MGFSGLERKGFLEPALRSGAVGVNGAWVMRGERRSGGGSRANPEALGNRSGLERGSQQGPAAHFKGVRADC